MSLAVFFGEFSALSARKTERLLMAGEGWKERERESVEYWW